MSVASNIINKMKVGEYSRIFLVGKNATRVTFASQQKRALNLLWALSEEKKIHAGDRIAIVGAGLAGLTAAVAADILGGNVTLYEKKSDPLHLQRGNNSRYIHPNLFEWPDSAARDPLTHLPFLNWSEDTCGNIARWILEQWTELRANIEECSSTEVVIDGELDSKALLSANGTQHKFDLIVLCPGFGLERSVDGIPFMSYWENDNLAGPSLRHTGHRTFLISGTGDGGLIDLARILIRDFDHERFTRCLELEELQDARDKFLEIELLLKQKLRDHEFENDIEETAGAWLSEKYSSLAIPTDFIAKHISVRSDTSVVLNGRKSEMYSINASLINRFTLWLLSSLDSVSYKAGPLAVSGGLKQLLIEASQFLNSRIKSRFGVEISFPGLQYGPPYKVRFGSESTEWFFDELVIRHGPVSPLAQLLNNKDLAGELMRPDSTDDTYKQLYPSFFSSNLVRFHNGLLEEQEQLNWLRHASHNLPYLAQELRENKAVISVGYFIKARQFSVTAYKKKLGSKSIPDEFRRLKVQRYLVPEEGIVHNNFRPFRTDTLHCGMPTEFRAPTVGISKQSRIGFFITTADVDVVCVLPFLPEAIASLDVYRADFDLSEDALIGSILRVHEVGSTPENPGSVLVKLGTRYSASNSFESAKLKVAGVVPPMTGQAVLTFRHEKPAGVICQTGYRAAVRLNGNFCSFDNCFNVIPTSTEPFANPEDLGSLIAAADGKAVGVIIGTSLGQALAIPISVVLKQFDATLL